MNKKTKKRLKISKIKTKNKNNHSAFCYTKPCDKQTKNTINVLGFSMCPQINIDMFSDKVKPIVFENQNCSAFPLIKTSNLYKYLNYNHKGEKKTYLVQKMKYDKKETLESLFFTGLTTKEYKEYRKKWINKRKKKF
tara:strand:- start:109 stop:519 length:411 start_codon:yes stop_codon:yes gene_type:complete